MPSTSTIELTAADGFRFPAYLARPSGTPRGAVVVLQEIFGLNAHIRQVSDGFAADGYLAVAPATFQRVRLGVELGYGPDDVNLGRELKAAVEALPAPGVMQDVQAAVDHAAQASGGKVAVLGYCWGGLLTWRAAALCHGLAAAVPYYGGGMTMGTEPARVPRCPVLAHFGTQDMGIPMDTVEAFVAAQAGKQPAVQVLTWEANHGFNCDHRGSWHAPSAAAARERTLAFLAQHVG